jgi:thioredoxin 1
VELVIHKEKDMKRVLYFGADWCTPCKVMKPLVQKLSDKYAVEFKYVDLDYYSDIAIQHNITNVPTLILIKDNAEIARISGLQTQWELEKFLRN